MLGPAKTDHRWWPLLFNLQSLSRGGHLTQFWGFTTWLIWALKPLCLALLQVKATKCSFNLYHKNNILSCSTDRESHVSEISFTLFATGLMADKRMHWPAVPLLAPQQTSISPLALQAAEKSKRSHQGTRDNTVTLSYFPAHTHPPSTRGEGGKEGGFPLLPIDSTQVMQVQRLENSTILGWLDLVGKNDHGKN